MNSRKEILLRMYLIYILSGIFALIILSRVIYIQFIEGDELRAKAKEHCIKEKNIEARRGDIYSSDGTLLASSIPIYQIHMDMAAQGLPDSVFKKNVDSLAICLSNLYKDKSWKEYKRALIKARKKKNRYFLVNKKKVGFSELKQLKTFPILRLGKNKGGFLPELDSTARIYPNGMLARRTIGYFKKENSIKVGLEGTYNKQLAGVGGLRLMQRIAGNTWMPLHEDNEIEPKDGSDIITSIDINIQDVAENSLLKMLDSLDADYGCVVLMEVKTGNIKAIVNLGKNANGNYTERENYASKVRSDPGSTFKLVSLLAAMEDGYIKDIDSLIDIGSGRWIFGKRDTVRDSHEAYFGKKSVSEIFEMSSNVGFAKIFDRFYKNDNEKLYQRLKHFGLTDTLGLEIEEIKPLIKKPPYLPISVHRMAYGYELELTPIQTLTIYNAIANNGVMVKPRLVTEIRNNGVTVSKFPPVVVNERFCSPQSVKNARLVLERVVERGTAKNLMKNFHIKIAGKTGTARIIENGKYVKKYRSTFVGYFPANDPQYSCIVLISNPQGVYYGSLAAGPVFKEIAEKVYSSRLELHKEVNANARLQYLPSTKNGALEDIMRIYHGLGIGFEIGDVNTPFVKPVIKDKRVQLNSTSVKKRIVPDVKGMSLKDALYILENAGLKVKIVGKGNINSQSIPAGSPIKKGSQIILRLS